MTKYLAVKFYYQVDNPYDIPLEWPCESFPIPNEKSCPDDYTVMTEEQYNAYLSEHSAAKEEWNERFYNSKEYLGIE